MIIIYQISLFFYFIGIALVSPFNKKASLFIKGRRGLLARIKKEVHSDFPIIWVHSASVGEFEQARPLIEKYKAEGGKCKILLTFFSPSGYELRKYYQYADWVYYLPKDTSFNAAAFLEIVNPSLAIFVKYEFWYHFLLGLKMRNIPTYIVSAIFRPSQPFFKWYGGIYRKMLGVYKTLFVQNESSKNLLNGIGVENVVVSGDTRFDRVYSLVKENRMDNEVFKSFCKERIVLVAGSTWEKDEQMLANTLSFFENIKLLVVPHEVNSSRIEKIEQIFKAYNVVRYSKCSASDSCLKDAQVMVVDCMGLLSSLYRYGKVSYVGGGFGMGIHNILEAATYGRPIIFGPNYEHFQEACDLIDLGGAFCCRSSKQFSALLTDLIENPAKCQMASQISRQYVEEHLGATEIIISKIEKEIEKN